VEGIQKREEVKLALYADDIIIHLKYPIKSTNKLIDIINIFSKEQIQNHYKTSLAFHYISSG
jgi:hypothetical protein